MSYESLLIDLCTIRRYTEGAADAYGNPTLTWADHLANEPCRLTSSSGREIKVGAEIVIADYKLFLSDVDIIEQDRVIAGGNTYEVLLVQNYADSASDHHKQCWLRIAR